MGTIADKLTYLNGTKQALKESINNLGGDITSETTFREYAQELDQIYDNIPKTTDTGTNLSLNTIKGKMNIIPKGDTQQTQYSGYNELNIYAVHPKGYTETVNGVTIKYNDNGSITATGTATADINYFLGSRATLGDLFNGTYYLSGCTTGSNSTYYLSMWADGIGVYPQTTTEVATNKTSGVNWNIVIAIKNGTTINYTFYPMMCSTSGKSFEPYTNGASPNPTYPQNIEVVTGTQVVKVENKNLLPNPFTAGTMANGITLEILQDKKIKITGTATATEGVTKTLDNPIKLKANESYTFSVGTKQGGYGIYLQNTNGTNLYYLGVSTTNSYVTFTPNTDVEIAKITLHFPSGYTINTTIYLQLEKGSVATTYVEHQEQIQQISLGDIELCKIGNYQDYLYKTSGKNVVDWANINYSNLNGASSTRTGNEYNVVAGDTQWGHVRFTQTDLNLKPNTNYVFRARIKSTTNTNGARIRVISSMNVGGVDMYSNATTTGNVAVLSFTTPSTIPSDGAICLYPYAANTNATFSEIMIYEGTNTSLPYEPYGTGEWYKKEYIRKINVNSTNWQYIAVAQGSLFRSYGVGAIINSTCFCTHYTCLTQQTRTNPCTYINGDNPIIDVIDSRYTSVNDFKTWCTNNNVEWYIQLSIPNDIQITNTNLIEQLDNLEKLKSYNGTTNISTNGNLPIVLGVSALKGE